MNINKIEEFITRYFNEFIPYAPAHYNAQLDLLIKFGKINRGGYYYVGHYDSSTFNLAVNYFVRNRSRLLEWYCIMNDNVLMSDYEFCILNDLYGFNYAFETICLKKFGIEVCPDEKYDYGYPVIDKQNVVDHTVVHAIMQNMI